MLDFSSWRRPKAGKLCPCINLKNLFPMRRKLLPNVSGPAPAKTACLKCRYSQRVESERRNGTAIILRVPSACITSIVHKSQIILTDARISIHKILVSTSASTAGHPRAHTCIIRSQDTESTSVSFVVVTCFIAAVDPSDCVFAGTGRSLRGWRCWRTNGRQGV